MKVVQILRRRQWADYQIGGFAGEFDCESAVGIGKLRCVRREDTIAAVIVCNANTIPSGGGMSGVFSVEAEELWRRAFGNAQHGLHAVTFDPCIRHPLAK